MVIRFCQRIKGLTVTSIEMHFLGKLRASNGIFLCTSGISKISMTLLSYIRMPLKKGINILSKCATYVRWEKISIAKIEDIFTDRSEICKRFCLLITVISLRSFPLSCLKIILLRYVLTFAWAAKDFIFHLDFLFFFLHEWRRWIS